MPPAVLTLTPAAAGQEAAGHGHSGTDPAALDPATLQAMLDADDGPGFWTIAGWVVAALAAAAGVIAVLRSRRPHREPAGEPGEAKDDDAKELVGAAKAPRVTSWSYQDGPSE